MCNIYLMYYTDSEEDVGESCAGNEYVSLENEIPVESLSPPPKIVNTNDNSKPALHHEMEGSRMNSKNDKFKQQQQQKNKNGKLYKVPDLSSIYNNYALLKQKKPILKQNDQQSSDEYYEDVESARSKDRYNDNFNIDYNNQDDYGGNSFFDSVNDFDYSALDPASTSSLYSAINSEKIKQQKKKPNVNTKVSSKLKR